MKKNHFGFFFCSLILLLLTINKPCYAQGWGWARTSAGVSTPSTEKANSVYSDGLGHVYVTGSFTDSTMVLGSTTLTNTTPVSADVFIAKYDTAGNVLWARSGGGTSYDFPSAITSDKLGNVYVAGNYSSPSVIFSGNVLSNSVSGAPDVFVLKYDASGNLLFAKHFGGSYIDEANGIAVDTFGNIYVTGILSDWFLFGSGSIVNPGAVGQDLYVLKYDAAGNEVWARSAGATGSGSAKSNSISISPDSKIYIAGEYYGDTLKFGTIKLPNNPGGKNMFVAKYDSSGSVLWAKSPTASAFNNAATSVSVDTIGNSFVVGFFEPTSITFGTSVLNNPAGQDMFIVKYDSSGTELWAKSAGGSSGGINDRANAVCTDSEGNAYVCGDFNSPSILFGTTTLTNSGTPKDVFLVKYDASGDPILAFSGGGSSGDDSSLGISADAYGDCYIAGYYQSATCSFGSSSLTNTGGMDWYLAKLSGPSIPTTSIEHFESGMQVDLYPNPTKGKFVLNLNEEASGKIEVFNVLGECVGLFVLQNQKSYSIDLSHLCKGVYVVKLSVGSGTSTHRICIQ